jgi:hypothetical protein
MRSEDLQKEIDDVLARSQVWEPPAHFARMVGVQATGLVARELAARELPGVFIMSPNVVRAAVPGVLVAATAYVAQLFVLAPMADGLASDWAAAPLDAYARFITQAFDQWAANAVAVAWASAALSLGAAAWFTRGIRPFSFPLR